jgi:hypothetical protein
VMFQLPVLYFVVTCTSLKAIAKKKKKISAENIFVIVVSQISEAGAARS